MDHCEVDLLGFSEFDEALFDQQTFPAALGAHDDKRLALLNPWLQNRYVVLDCRRLDCCRLGQYVIDAVLCRQRCEDPESIGFGVEAGCFAVEWIPLLHSVEQLCKDPGLSS